MLPPDGSDPRCQPHKLTGPLPVGDDCVYRAYFSKEHAVWQALYTRMVERLPSRAADEFVTGLAPLGLDHDKTPALAAVSRQLQRATGWRIARTPACPTPMIFLRISRGVCFRAPTIFAAGTSSTTRRRRTVSMTSSATRR